jgi:membrane-bound ClpP family serine protease
VTDGTSDPSVRIKEISNALSERFDADILMLNFEIITPIDFMFIQAVAGRERRKNVVLVLVTEGGLADSAFRMMRFLQSNYERVTVVVPGWCKSAGTLMCIGAHEVWIGDFGELGPLDVQIVKADEMDEQKSGLAAEAAFEKLQQEAFKFFMGFVRDVGASEYRVTLRTASDIATKMTIGVIQPIFDKLEPVTIGEDYRSNRLAQAYAE